MLNYGNGLINLCQFVTPEPVVSHLDMFSCTLHCLVYLIGVLTGSVDCLFNLGLVGVFTLVLVNDTPLTTAPLRIIQKLYGALHCMCRRALWD